MITMSKADLSDENSKGPLFACNKTCHLEIQDTVRMKDNICNGF
jgi:hypothetical protein